jgi:hypothetical protein
VVFEVECIDRMYCNVYVPKLQFAAGLLGYVQRQLGLPIASTAPLGKITDVFSIAMRRFARDQRVPWVDFVKGQRKDEVMHQHLAGFDRDQGALFIGRAQEKTALFRTERRRDANGTSATVRGSVMTGSGQAGGSRSQPPPPSGTNTGPARHHHTARPEPPRPTRPRHVSSGWGETPLALHRDVALHPQSRA